VIIAIYRSFISPLLGLKSKCVFVTRTKEPSTLKVSEIGNINHPKEPKK